MWLLWWYVITLLTSDNRKGRDLRIDSERVLIRLEKSITSVDEKVYKRSVQRVLKF